MTSWRHTLSTMRPRFTRVQRVLLAMAALTGCLAGCSSSSMVASTHGYVLVHTQEGVLTPLPDDDPLYTSFDQVLQDDFLRCLIDVFEHTTRAYLTTGTPNRLRGTVANYPILVLDSAAPGLLYDVTLQSNGRYVKVECALGLGRDGRSDLSPVREDMAAASAPWLLALVGIEADPGAERLPLDQPAAPEAALVAGLAAALDALHLDALAVAAETTAPFAQAPEPVVDQARLTRYRALQTNAYASSEGSGQPTDERLPRDQAMRTPGMAATFLYRLLQQTGAYTPQRYMLWFLSYKAPEMPLAKLLRVCLRMGQSGDLSMDALARYYADTYPAERDAVTALFNEVYEAAPDEVR